MLARRNILGLLGLAGFALLVGCAEPQRISAQQRGDLVVTGVSFKAPAVFGYGDGLIGKAISADQVEPLFAQAIFRHLSSPTGTEEVSIQVNFTQFTLSTGVGMVFGGNVAAEVSGLVQVTDARGNVLGSTFVSTDAAGVTGELSGGAFRTADEEKIAVLAEKFARSASRSITSAP